MGVVSQNRGITGSIYIPPSGGGGGGGMITNVTGVVANNNTLTITGTNLIQENKTNWDSYFTSTHPNASGFEGASGVADGYDMDTSSPAPAYTSAQKLMGSQSLHITDGNGFVGWFTGASQGSPGWSDFYLAQYSMWNVSSWASSPFYWKYWWLVGTDLATGYGFWQLAMNNDRSTPNSWQLSGSIVDGAGNTNVFANIPDGTLENNRWYLIEFRCFCSGSGGTPVIQCWIDNTMVINQVAVEGCGPRGSGWQSNVNNAGGVSGDLWHDRFVSSHTRVGPASLIEIGNGSSVYTSANKRWQPPVSLNSETSIQCSVRLPSGGGPYWLWVTNNSGTRSQAWAL